MASPLPADTTQLRKALEWELTLDVRDLRSHAWYHGNISRMRADEIVEREGDFLVRDCTSQPGNYVLTCHCKGQGLHFVINKVVIQPDTVYERVQYQFEDDAYDTVPDLITCYVGSGKSITAQSGARIQFPQNRLYPLSFYVTKFGLQQHDTAGVVSPLVSPHAASATMRFSPYNTSTRSPGQSPPRSKRETPPRLPCKKQRSHSITPSDLSMRSATLQHRPSGDRSNSIDGLMSRSFDQASHSTHSLPRSSLRRGEQPHKSQADSPLSPCKERHRGAHDDDDADDNNVSDQPPPKPSRVPSLLGSFLKDVHNPNNMCGDPLSIISPGQSKLQRDSDSGNGSGDSVLSSVTTDNSEVLPTNQSYCGVVIKNPRHSQVILLRDQSIINKVIEYDFAAEEALLLAYPSIQPDSVFDLDNFHTLLLPSSENRPLDETAMQGVRMMLQETGSRIIANQLTRIDLELTVGERKDVDVGPGVTCGIELCTLPQGHQMRMDLIERTECLKLLVAATILTCTSEEDRADTLDKWIQVAVDTKAALGNLFGFCGLMMGLCMPQVQRLAATWHVLRQRYTDSAFNYEAKLRPMIKSMNECTNPQAPNTTIPHLLPFVLLQELTFDHLTGCQPCGVSSSMTSCLGSWETASDFGLGTLFAHVEHARKVVSTLPALRRNANTILADVKAGDYLLADAFRTEFHLKFLWGSRGAAVDMEERHAKFEQVLDVMSEKCEPSLPTGT